MSVAKEGRTTIYNSITTQYKLDEVNPDNTQLEEDFLDYLSSTDKSLGTIKQYRSNLHVFWVWNLEHNKNKFFVDLTKREIAKFQNHAINVWHWSPKRLRVVKATLSSLSNYIENILDDEYPNFRSIVLKIESPVNEAVRTKAVYQLDDLKSLLDELVAEGKYQHACVLALAMYSGKRKAELTRFKVHYFDDSNLICGGALYKTPEKMVTKGRGRRGKLLDVYILAKPFKPYFDLWMAERERLGIKSKWLFPKNHKDENGEDDHIAVTTLDSYAKTFTQKLNKPFYFHAMRHAYTTYLLEQNLPENVVQMIQGWASSDMVRIYDDRTGDSQLEKYFGEGGIKQVEKKSLDDL